MRRKAPMSISAIYPIKSAMQASAARAQSWRATIKEAVANRSWRWLFKVAKEDTGAPPSYLTVNDQVVSDPQCMADAASHAWSILWRVPGTELHWEGHLGHVMQRRMYPFPEYQHCEVPALSFERLKGLILQIPVWKAAGPDGWRVRELQCLHDDLLRCLLDFLVACEHAQRWPDSLATVYVLLDKGNGQTGPLDMRPIGLTSLVYRLCGRLRLQDCQRHLEEHWPLEFRAGRRGSGVEDAVWHLRWQLQHGGDTVGAHLDFTKAYETISFEMVRECLLCAGLAEAVVSLVCSQYAAPRSIKIGGIVSSQVCASRGIIAGCPFAVAAMNLHLGGFLAALRRQRLLDASTWLRTWVDDVVCVVHGLPEQAVRRLSVILHRIQDWAHLARGSLNEKKSAVWSIALDGRRRLCDRLPQFLQSLEVRDSGVDVTFGGMQTNLHHLQRGVKLLFGGRASNADLTLAFLRGGGSFNPMAMQHAACSCSSAVSAYATS